MSFRIAASSVLVLVSVFVLVGCGGSRNGAVSGGESLTPELVVPPGSQEGAKALSATATATPVPTSTATVESMPTEVVEKVRVRVPNRGYNAMGSNDALIVMFEFSDFL